MVTATRRTALQPVGLLLVLLAASPTRAPSSGGDIARAFAGAFSSPLGSAGVADAAQIKMQKPSQRDGYMPKEGKSKRRKGNGANSKKPLRPRKSRRARESWGVDGSPPPVCMSEYELCKSRRPKNFAAKRECLLSEYRQEVWRNADSSSVEQIEPRMGVGSLFRPYHSSQLVGTVMKRIHHLKVHIRTSRPSPAPLDASPANLCWWCAGGLVRTGVVVGLAHAVAISRAPLRELSVRCLSYLELSRDCNMAALNQV